MHKAVTDVIMNADIFVRLSVFVLRLLIPGIIEIMNTGGNTIKSLTDVKCFDVVDDAPFNKT